MGTIAARADRRRRPDRGKSAAFTLIEVMTAMMVFVILTLLFATSLPVTRKTARMNGQYTQASSLCQHKIDQLRARGYGGLIYSELRNTGIIDSSPTGSPYSFTLVDDVRDVLPNAITQIRVENPTSADVPVSNVRSATKKVTVTIRWTRTTFENKTNEMSLTALITQ